MWRRVGAVVKKAVIISLEDISTCSKINFSELSKTGPTVGAIGITDETSAFHMIFDMIIVEETVKYMNVLVHCNWLCSTPQGNTFKRSYKNEIMALLGIFHLLWMKKGNCMNYLELWNTDGTGTDIVRTCTDMSCTDLYSFCVVQALMIR
jgi:hypothetical protein